MKFEKLNENKIRIILNNQDLIDKNIDFNTFMANSIEAQDLFLDMLEEAEEKVGFKTKDYKLKIEALAIESGEFVIIITRFTNTTNIQNSDMKHPEEAQSNPVTLSKSKKITAKRRTVMPNSDCLVYTFNSFDDVCNFSNHMTKFENYQGIAKSIQLYTYNSKYYLAFSKINTTHLKIRSFYATITEFGTYVSNPDLFMRKLSERGAIVMKNNAIKTCSKYFTM